MKKKLIAGGLILCTLALCACQTGKKQEKTEKAKTTAQEILPDMHVLQPCFLSHC